MALGAVYADGPASHDCGHNGIQQVQQIMIRNDGTSPLYLDAITPLHLRLESDDHDDHEESPGPPDPAISKRMREDDSKRAPAAADHARRR